MFEYDPEGGLLVSGQRETMLLEKDDLAQVPHALGHIKIERLLGDKPGEFSDREFERKLYEVCNSTENKINKITFIAKLIGIEWSQQDTDFCINRIASRNAQFSPEELLDIILDEIKEKYRWGHPNDAGEGSNLTKAIEGLKRTGVLDIDSRVSRNGIVSYFYLYCRLKNVNASNSEAVYNEGFNGFRFLDELMKEYERQPDDRFGDALLVACSQQKHEQDGEQNFEEERK